MTSNELLETIERLLEDEGFSQEAVTRLVLALALENRSIFEAYQKQTYRELAELRQLLERQGNIGKVLDDQADKIDDIAKGVGIIIDRNNRAGRSTNP